MDGVPEFRLPKTTGRLVFTDDYEGVEVAVLLSIPFGRFLEFQALHDIKSLDVEDVKAMFMAFADLALLEWNLTTDEGQAVPATGEGMMEIPMPLAMQVITSWANTVTEVDDPKASPDGEPSQEESPETENGSVSQVDSKTLVSSTASVNGGESAPAY